MRATLLLCVLLGLLALAWARFEPYKVLGVNRRATQPEIKKAYKNLAKKHHPDKNKGSKESEAMFLEINKAYELLSDPDRRRDYDNHGITEDTPNFRKRHDYAQYGRFDPHDSFFDSMFSGSSGFRFNFGGGGGGSGESRESLFHKQVITSKAYWNQIHPNSSKQPYLIMFFTNWCMTCVRIEPIWQRLVEELEPVGFHFASVLSSVEKELTRKVGANELPHMVLLLDGKVIHYKDPQFSALKVLEFIRRKFPYKSVELLDDSNVDAFLNGWSDNRVRVLLFGHTDVIRLRYLTTAFRYRHRAALGYIKVKDPKAQNIIKRFGVSKADKVETMLVFQENPANPIASVTMKDLSLNTMFEVLDTHQYLQLPRLSSQEIFDSLCPSESVRTRKRLCVTLISDKAASSDTPTFNPDGSPAPFPESPALKSLRDFSLEFKHDRVRFTYIWREKQADFVKSLLAGSTHEVVSDPDHRVAILWRRENNKLKFEWLKRRWDFREEDYTTSDVANASRDELSRTLKRLLTPNEVLPYETEIRDLFDEHAQSLFVRIANRMLEMVETLRESVTKDELLPAISLVVTVVFIIAGGYVMNYLVKMEEESVQRTLGAKGMKVDKKGKVVPELKIHELRAETYNGMVRLLKPGCRTVVLIVDKESKEKLVPKFYKMAWPYRRNKTLMFGFLFIEKGLPWFKKILNLTLPEPRDININPKNCIGTVLSLNGHRRYFCMFHAKHPEGSRKRIYTANNGSVAGAFMGFDSEFEEDTDERESDVEGQTTATPTAETTALRQRKNAAAAAAAREAALANQQQAEVPLLDSPDHLPIFEDQLLDGLQLWMDRLFEGSTYRYHINYWPEFPISPSAFTRN